MRRVLLFLLLGAFGLPFLSAQDASTSTRIYDITPSREISPQPFVYESRIRKEGWDTLTQIIFWRKVMRTPPEYGYVSLASNRKVLAHIKSDYYDDLNYQQKRALKDSVRRYYKLPVGEMVYVTYGRSDFYQIREAMPNIHKAVPLFEAEGVPAWYAQSILLIESPGKDQMSSTGAYGPFQLMKSVAIEQGLKVNSKVDERVNFEKAARASAKLIRNVCIPKTRAMLQQQGIAYQETDLWFRLLVLHVYHAGSGNVSGALRKCKTRVGGPELIQELWYTKYRGFGNASQNYSQVALAAYLELESIIRKEYKVVKKRVAMP